MSQTPGDPNSADGRKRAKAGFADVGIRTASSLVMAAVALLAGWYGGAAFRVLAVLIALVIFWEWMGMASANRHWRRWLIPAAAFLAVALAVLMNSQSGSIFTVLAIGLVCSFVSGWTTDKDFGGLAALVYAALSAICLALLRGDDHAGLMAILFLFAVVWATDILAYFCGRLIGGPKLAPAISPGKTWSGAVGGTVGGILAALAFAHFTASRHGLAVAAAAVLLSIFGQIGDLFESALKRRYKVKDSSHLIPGHGGVMDRVDGLVAAALVLFLIGGALAGFDNPARGLFHP